MTPTALLCEKHRVALREALDWLPSVVPPVAIVATGSIIRGNPHPFSDLDLVVLHDEPWRRRIQRWFNQTPVEVFFNSEAWLSHSIDAERSDGRPVMAHMLATGELLLDNAGRMQALRDRSMAVLERGPSLSADALMRDRYAAATQVEDALDLGNGDTPDARRMRALAVEALLRHEYLRTNRFLPRTKERLRTLSETSPELTSLLSDALSASAAIAVASLREAADQVLGTTGFFEWDSGMDSSKPGTVK